MVEWFRPNGTAREIAEASFASHDLSVSTTIGQAANRVRAKLAVLLECNADDIYVVGSTKFGVSLLHGHGFVSGEADLDLAVVSPLIFSLIKREAERVSGGFLHDHVFSGQQMPGKRTASAVRSTLIRDIQRSIVHTEYLPDLPIRRELLEFCADAKASESAFFSRVSVAFYGSTDAFLTLQSQRVSAFINAQSPSGEPSGLKMAGYADAMSWDEFLTHPFCADGRLASLLQRLGDLCALDYSYVMPVPVEVETGAGFDVLAFHNGVLKGAQPRDFFQLTGEFAEKGISVRMVPVGQVPHMAATVTANAVLTAMRELGESAVSRRILVLAPAGL
ncbi:hypothetical protein [Stenotrophomonas hibiscicola]|uniref:hypothetical protein n=1 Tax=Stenotrophomonas hibiscicola TaxID=86189 RepID=UPI002E798E18|nr:hypothetical protein [[Pseudomonas] hibiscicola]